MDNKAIFIGDMVDNNGKTVKESNLEKKHEFSVLQPVVFKDDPEFFEYMKEQDPEHISYMRTHKYPFYVVEQSRDCDGTPLYALSVAPIKLENSEPLDYSFKAINLPKNTDSISSALSFNKMLFLTGINGDALESVS